MERGEKRRSHPTWVRGLKRRSRQGIADCQGVAPHVGAWIETFVGGLVSVDEVSHPTWVRGLKLPLIGASRLERLSHPTWVRGLKLATIYQGRWSSWSHPTWVRGLKLRLYPTLVFLLRRTPRGCVD